MDLGLQEKQISSEKQLDKNHLHAKYFGIATHYCLEMMNNFDENSLKNSINLAQTRYSNYLDESDFIDIESRIYRLIKNDKFISLVEDASFISEQSLIYKEEIRILDLLLFKNDSYYILDYKTTKEKSNDHVKQVSFYKKAIKDIFNTSNVFSYLVYLQENDLSIDEV
jgi:exodeoxyribonuclease V beta subunit